MHEINFSIFFMETNIMITNCIWVTRFMFLYDILFHTRVDCKHIHGQPIDIDIKELPQNKWQFHKLWSSVQETKVSLNPLVSNEWVRWAKEGKKTDTTIFDASKIVLALCWVFQLVKNFDETCDANKRHFAMFAIVRFKVRLKDLMCSWVGSLAFYAAWTIWHLERICRTNDSLWSFSTLWIWKLALISLVFRGVEKTSNVFITLNKMYFMFH